ncbi:MAG: TIGR02147 family protein, partial [Fibrobacterota bacterium]|nr:TIGR02147 family protein [Fibrobacterota bacterium]
VAMAFKLGKLETEFFQILVSYAQARTNDEKDLFYQKILRNKRYATTKVLDRSQYDFFSHWYIPVVRELLTHKDFKGDCAWIAERIYPRISLTQVESAKKILEELDMVEWDIGSDRWRCTETSVRTDSEPAHLALRNYHMSVIQMAHDSLKNFKPADRDIRSITLGLSESGYLELKSRMENIWKDLLDFAGTQNETEKVYQVNLQLFPMTRDKRY